VQTMAQNNHHPLYM
jgi:DNA polymerase sigma